jgi:hypothetical protein
MKTVALANKRPVTGQHPVGEQSLLGQEQPRRSNVSNSIPTMESKRWIRQRDGQAKQPID